MSSSPPPRPMVAQELRGMPVGEATDPWDVDRQEAIYRERKAERTVRRHGEFIIVCGDEVFVGRV